MLLIIKMYIFLDILTCQTLGSISWLSAGSCHYPHSCVCDFAACYSVITSADVYIVGVKYFRFNWHFKNVFKRQHYDSALKWKVIVCVENHGNNIGTFLLLVMPTLVAGEMITILYFLAKKQQNALQDLRKEEIHKLTKLCNILSVRHLQNNCLSSCQVIAVKGRRNCQNPQNWSNKIQSRERLLCSLYGEDCH